MWPEGKRLKVGRKEAKKKRRDEEEIRKEARNRRREVQEGRKPDKERRD